MSILLHSNGNRVSSYIIEDLKATKANLKRAGFKLLRCKTNSNTQYYTAVKA